MADCMLLSKTKWKIKLSSTFVLVQEVLRRSPLNTNLESNSLNLEKAIGIIKKTRRHSEEVDQQ